MAGWLDRLSKLMNSEYGENDEEDVYTNKEYTTNAICKNCNHEQKVIVPRKNSIRRYIRKVKCDKCGLKNLKKKPDYFNDFDFDATWKSFGKANKLPKEEYVKIKSLSGKGEVKIKSSQVLRIKTRPKLDDCIELKEFKDVIKLSENHFISIYVGVNEIIYIIGNVYYRDKKSKN